MARVGAEGAVAWSGGGAVSEPGYSVHVIDTMTTSLGQALIVRDAAEHAAGGATGAEVARRYEAELMAGRLRASGIDARVIDKSFRQEPLPTVRSFAIVRVYVPADRAEEAQRILEDPGAPSDESEDETP